jgi:uncharacterized Zn finger protein
MGYYGGWAPYISVAERRKKAEKEAAKARKSGASLLPVEPYRGAIAKTFWGKAWCDNLEAYSDYANRMPRGRTYVRNGSVIDLKITEGSVLAQVMGSSLYKVTVKVTSVGEIPWQAIGKDCSGSIDSLVELLQGKLSTAVMQRICAPRTGLFPAPKEIKFSCSCPDSALMCKHIAAVLYGVGARLDQKPELLFSLRGVDAKDLVSQASAGLPKSETSVAADKVLDDAMLADVFGLEMDDAVAPAKSAGSRKKAPATHAIKKVEKKPTTKTVITTTQPPATKTKKRAASEKAAPLTAPKPVKQVVESKKAATPKRVTPAKKAVAVKKTSAAKKTVTGQSPSPQKSSARKDASGRTKIAPKVPKRKATVKPALKII